MQDFGIRMSIPLWSLFYNGILNEKKPLEQQYDKALEFFSEDDRYLDVLIKDLTSHDRDYINAFFDLLTRIYVSELVYLPLFSQGEALMINPQDNNYLFTADNNQFTKHKISDRAIFVKAEKYDFFFLTACNEEFKIDEVKLFISSFDLNLQKIFQLFSKMVIHIYEMQSSNKKKHRTLK